MIDRYAPPEGWYLVVAGRRLLELLDEQPPVTIIGIYRLIDQATPAIVAMGEEIRRSFESLRPGVLLLGKALGADMEKRAAGARTLTAALTKNDAAMKRFQGAGASRAIADLRRSIERERRR